MTGRHREGGLSTAFRLFAERECAGHSPLYEALARAVADDDGLLALADCAGAGQPRPNMLFAAVHFLLLREPPNHDLAAYYPSLTEDPAPPSRAFAAFKAFCAERRSEIGALLAARRVATNEVQRSACLLPAFLTVARLAPEPLHLIEIGASAGLNLLWDRFHYDYGAGRQFGPGGAPLTLRCELRGPPPQAWPDRLPTVGTRLGLDLEPMDPADPDDALWLRALVWPEQKARADRLSAALDLAARLKPEVRRGDGLVLLPRIAGQVPAAGTLCVFHAFTLNQAPEAARRAFEEVLDGIGRHRPLWHIAFEWGDGPAPELILSKYQDGHTTTRRLAQGDAHGAWLAWCAGELDDASLGF